MTPLAKDSGAGLDLVIEKSERPCNYLQNQVNKKSCSGLADNGTNSQNTTEQLGKLGKESSISR